MKRNQLIMSVACLVLLLVAQGTLAEEQTAVSGTIRVKPPTERPLFNRIIEKATSTGSASTTASSTIRQKLDAKRDEKSAEKCDKITSQIDTHIGNIEQWSLDNVSAFQQVSVNIKNALPALQAKGIDVTKVTADLATLDTKIAKLRADKVILEEKLKSTKDFQCGNSEGDFKTALKNVRDQHKLVNDDRKDIVTFINDTLRPDVKVLRGEKIEIKIEGKASSTREAEIKANLKAGKPDRNVASKTPETLQ